MTYRIIKYCTYISLVTLLVYALYMPYARADVVTEFGMGIKLDSTTSFVLQHRCEQVNLQQQDTWYDSSPVAWREKASCGGDNPAFIGWPIAWDSDWKGPWKVRVGWFHFSHWFDGSNAFDFGGDRHETHTDMIAATTTFNWTRLRNKRRKK